MKPIISSSSTFSPNTQHVRSIRSRQIYLAKDCMYALGHWVSNDRVSSTPEEKKSSQVAANYSTCHFLLRFCIVLGMDIHRLPYASQRKSTIMRCSRIPSTIWKFLEHDVDGLASSSIHIGYQVWLVRPQTRQIEAVFSQSPLRLWRPNSYCIIGFEVIQPGVLGLLAHALSRQLHIDLRN